MAKRRRRQRLPIASKTYVIIIMSLIEMGFFAIALLLSIRGIYAGGKIIGALGTICMLSSLAAMIVSVGMMFEHEYSLLSRIIGFICPALMFIVWTGTYLIGFLSV